MKNRKAKLTVVLALAILLIFMILIIFSKINCKSTNETYTSENYSNIGINQDLLNIIYFNVGQADSTLITINNKTMLIDSGNDSDGYYIADFLKAQNINKIDYLILTHYDEDHIGGAYKIIEELDIGIIYTPKTIVDSETYKKLIDVAKDKVEINTSLQASDEIIHNLR